MKAIRTLLACIRKADQTYNLIQHGDKIVIGLSGGKDSIALTYCLSLYRKFSHTDFKIQPVVLNLGFPGFNPQPLIEFCRSLDLDLIVSDNTDVYKILEIQKENQNYPGLRPILARSFGGSRPADSGHAEYLCQCRSGHDRK